MQQFVGIGAMLESGKQRSIYQQGDIFNIQICCSLEQSGLFLDYQRGTKQ